MDKASDVGSEWQWWINTLRKAVPYPMTRGHYLWCSAVRNVPHCTTSEMTECRTIFSLSPRSKYNSSTVRIGSQPLLAGADCGSLCGSPRKIKMAMRRGWGETMYFSGKGYSFIIVDVCICVSYVWTKPRLYMYTSHSAIRLSSQPNLLSETLTEDNEVPPIILLLRNALVLFRV